ncbi:MAG TPA: hypothetical protein VFX70_02630 [Mycobacteriales bacterium]|nr:hypothetical protein [Mycobacteriales bacterium]
MNEARDHYSPRPYPGPTDPYRPTDAQLVAYARQVLAWHKAVPTQDGRVPSWCTCGSALVLCPYQGAATRFLCRPPQDAR